MKKSKAKRRSTLFFFAFRFVKLVREREKERESWKPRRANAWRGTKFLFSRKFEDASV